MRRRDLIAAALVGAHPAVTSAASGVVPCAVPDPPPARGRTLAVRTFGAAGDGAHDDTAAIERALAALQPGDTLRFGPGRFVHAARLVVAVPRVHLLADGATLHASNPTDQALLIQADGVVVRGFTLTAVTDRRRGAPWESRIAIWRDGPRALRAVSGVHIVDNRIVEAGAPGTPLANSSSSAAIFVHHARDFTVARNLVRRSLSDAIHVTGGSSQGRVAGNTVRESGDDMVAVVSYLPLERDRRGAPTLVRDVLIDGNDLAGQYWGRGISVVGGEGITIEGNRVDAATHAAGVYLAREASWRTHGVRRVRVSGNTITRVQTVAPEYAVLDAANKGKRTGHGAIEVVAEVADDERESIDTSGGLGVADVLIVDNVVRDIGTDGIRIGYGWGRQSATERVQPGGGTKRVGITAGPVRRVTMRDNSLGAIRGAALTIFNAADGARALACAGNTIDGRPLTDAACASARSSATTPAASGRAPRCK